ncbi:DUF2958 domain-containing protein [Larkinella punicea]|uniref:DUF2958 domain-containing protein n=1 Tax=Larkinella punicea TaxID=2315727 RepID=A0A368JIP6_9BACT|nr:DUF2958 domain-containing protein [Larkinella punicea]RCR67529.1 DUF2958 domain-containing protein [Larkinella punicea]
MKLFTQSQYRQLLKNGDPILRGKDHFPVVKLFTPDANATWLITEIDPYAPDTAFGLCDLGLDAPELGYINLFELTTLGGYLRLPVERDRCFTATHPISVYAQAARMAWAITEESAALQLAEAILKAE